MPTNTKTKLQMIGLPQQLFGAVVINALRSVPTYSRHSLAKKQIAEYILESIPKVDDKTWWQIGKCKEILTEDSKDEDIAKLLEAIENEEKRRKGEKNTKEPVVNCYLRDDFLRTLLAAEKNCHQKNNINIKEILTVCAMIIPYADKKLIRELYVAAHGPIGTYVGQPIVPKYNLVIDKAYKKAYPKGLKSDNSVLTLSKDYAPNMGFDIGEIEENEEP